MTDERIEDALRREEVQKERLREAQAEAKETVEEAEQLEEEVDGPGESNRD